MTRRVLVTGATGLIGRMVVAELKRQRCEVVALGRGTDVPGADMSLVADLLDPHQTEAAIAQAQATDLVHLAWYRGAQNRWSTPLNLDWAAAENCARAWYVSEEKLEPRLGERFEEPISDYEQPLAPARDATLAFEAMQDWPDDTPIAEFLLRHPEHRHSVRRAQISRIAPYGEIRDNTISAQVMPIDMLRAKLSFFGATHFDPRSDRWVRICMYSGAPYPEELNAANADLWVYPEVVQ